MAGEASRGSNSKPFPLSLGRALPLLAISRRSSSIFVLHCPSPATLRSLRCIDFRVNRTTFPRFSLLDGGPCFHPAFFGWVQCRELVRRDEEKEMRGDMTYNSRGTGARISLTLMGTNVATRRGWLVSTAVG